VVPTARGGLKRTEHAKQQQGVLRVIGALNKYLCLRIDQREDTSLSASCLKRDGLLAQEPAWLEANIDLRKAASFIAEQLCVLQVRGSQVG